MSILEHPRAATAVTALRSGLRAFGRPSRGRGKLEPSATGGESTQIAQSLPQVVERLAEQGASRVVLCGDGAFRDAFEAAATGTAITWASSQFDDRALGARALEAVDVAGTDAVVVGGPEVDTLYRHALRRLHAEAPEIPVFWVSEKFEYCRGTLPIPVEVETFEALAFNHFEQFFGLKDPLQFTLELLAGENVDVVRRQRVLGPNESWLVRLKELAPERSGPVCLSITIAHPSLTRGRHYRFRACADAFWRGSLTTMHGGHKFHANPDKLKQHRLATSTLRAGRLVVTVPNYDLDLGRDDEVVCTLGEATTRHHRVRQARLEVIDFEKPAEEGADGAIFGVRYRGFGTSFWYGLEEGVSGPSGPIDCLSSNHLGTVDVALREDARMTAAEATRLAAVEAAGFRVYPHVLPVLSGRDDLAFGIHFDACNPPIEDIDVDFFSADGAHVGTTGHEITESVTFVDEVAAHWDDPRRGEAALALVTPAWSRLGLSPQRTLCKDAHIVLRHLRTHDQDMSESQAAWRNLGVEIPEFPHWLHPRMGVMGRTNLVARARCDAGLRTAVVLANGSGALDYATHATADVTVYRLDGALVAATVPLPPFAIRLEWLDELIPELADHLGPEGIGALHVRCAEADLNAQIVTVTPGGSVSLQHLWGY